MRPSLRQEQLITAERESVSSRDDLPQLVIQYQMFSHESIHTRNIMYEKDIYDYICEYILYTQERE